MSRDLLRDLSRDLHRDLHSVSVELLLVRVRFVCTHFGGFQQAAPASVPNTIGWNSTMPPNNIINQLMATYGRANPDAVRQYNLAFIVAYNPKDPPEIFLKQCVDCQEITIIAKVPFTNEQMLMNIINLLTGLGLYRRDMDNWDWKPNANKTYLLLCPFIQDAYQCHLSSGAMTTSQGAISSHNQRQCIHGRNR